MVSQKGVAIHVPNEAQDMPEETTTRARSRTAQDKTKLSNGRRRHRRRRFPLLFGNTNCWVNHRNTLLPLVYAESHRKERQHYHLHREYY